jgi:hypothetical protein
MFKIVTRANANPAKREPFAIRTRGKISRENALYHGAKLWIFDRGNIVVYRVELQKRKLQTRKNVETCCHCSPTPMRFGNQFRPVMILNTSSHNMVEVIEKVT